MRRKRFTLDGLALPIREFIRVNAFHGSDILKIYSLPVGGRIVYGGGAAPVFVLRRVA